MWNMSNAAGSLSVGRYANNLIDSLVPGRLERFMPLPRYHPWLFGIGMLGWGMTRQAALMRGSQTTLFGLDFPMFPNISSDGGIFGNGSARSGLMYLGLIVGASTLATIIQESN
jgi:hypothetical protein